MATIHEFVIEIIEEIVMKTVDTWITTMDEDIPQLDYKELVPNTKDDDYEFSQIYRHKIIGCHNMYAG